MLRIQFHLIVGVWLMAFATAEAAVFRPVVSTSYGKVQGVVTSVKGSNRKVHTFLGIPFAKAPVGDLRFSPPQPPEPWTNVRDASSFPQMCTQALTGNIPNLGPSEDCLFLNVHTPESETGSLNTRKPVMVRIPGEAPTFGGASIDDGSALAATERAVVVAIQYRLGILGFYSTDDKVAPESLGRMDEIAALKWVNKEISNFGGDPNNVTIFGQSARGVRASALKP